MKSIFHLSLLINIIFIACAAKPTVSTWMIKENGLIHHAGTLNEAKSFIEANGWRCYSPEDDQTWRDREALCCGKAGL